MKVIPAIDLYNGEAVRLHKGSYQEVTVYDKNPINTAKAFKDAGFNHIHIVDLNGAKEGKFVNLPIIQSIMKELNISVQTGGGIRSFEDVKMLVDAGINGVICSSMAIKNEVDWLKSLQEFQDRMILGMDLKNGKIAYSGWLETADEDTWDFLRRMIDKGLQKVLCTDISKDGTLAGPNVELYRKMKEEFPEIYVIASGGVANASDLEELTLAKSDAVVVGKAYYEHRITLDKMKELSS